MKSKEKERKLLSVQAIAAQTSYREATVREWANERRIPHVRLGRSIRIAQDDLDAFIARNTISAK